MRRGPQAASDPSPWRAPPEGSRTSSRARHTAAHCAPTPQQHSDTLGDEVSFHVMEQGIDARGRREPRGQPGRELGAARGRRLRCTPPRRRAHHLALRRAGWRAAVRQRRYGEGVFLAPGGEKGREPKTPAVGLRNRCCVVKPDPITTHGQSPWGASEGEGRLSTATSAAYQVLLKYAERSTQLIRDRQKQTAFT